MAHATSNPSKVSLQRKLQGLTKPLVLLSCEVSFNKLKVVNDMTMAEAFRQSWTCQPLKKKHPPLVAVCHVAGVIKKIYKDLHWVVAGLDKHHNNEDDRSFALEMTSLGSPSDTWNFYANEAPEYNYLIGVDLSAELTQRGMANPVRYVNCD